VEYISHTKILWKSLSPRKEKRKDSYRNRKGVKGIDAEVYLARRVVLQSAVQ
jgi:hypothetical protein